MLLPSFADAAAFSLFMIFAYAAFTFRRRAIFITALMPLLMPLMLIFAAAAFAPCLMPRCRHDGFFFAIDALAPCHFDFDSRAANAHSAMRDTELLPTSRAKAAIEAAAQPARAVSSGVRCARQRDTYAYVLHAFIIC